MCLTSGEPALDCESVSLSSSTTTSTGGGGGARHRGGGGLRALLPRSRRLEAASPDSAVAGHQDAEIPEQLRGPAVPQVSVHSVRYQVSAACPGTCIMIDQDVASADSCSGPEHTQTLATEKDKMQASSWQKSESRPAPD